MPGRLFCLAWPPRHKDTKGNQPQRNEVRKVDLKHCPGVSGLCGLSAVTSVRGNIDMSRFGAYDALFDISSTC